MKQSEATSREKLMASNAADVVDDLSRQVDELANELIRLYGREKRLLNGIRKRDESVESLRLKLAERDEMLARRKADVAELKEHLKRRKAEVIATNEQLERIRSTKVMKMQRSYWRARTRLRGKGREGTQA